MLTRLKVMSALQALMMPERAYGVTHERAWALVKELTGMRPVGTPPRPGMSMEELTDWLRKNCEELDGGD